MSTMSPLLHILIVDDDLNVRTALRDYFELSGYEVTVADDGASALRLLEEHPAFDLVLLDHRMPDKDGLEVLQEAKQAGLDAPVLMLTGYHTPEFCEEARQLGAADCLAKPFAADELLERIGEIIRAS